MKPPTLIVSLAAGRHAFGSALRRADFPVLPD